MTKIISLHFKNTPQDQALAKILLESEREKSGYSSPIKKRMCEKCERETVHELRDDGDYERYVCQVCQSETEYRVR